MAIDFTSGYVLKNQSLVADYPFTMACWIYPDVVNIEQAPMALIDKDSVNSYFCDLHVYPNGTCGLRIFNGSQYEETTPTGAISASTWTHLCGVYSSSTSRSAFKNGGGKTTGTTSATLGNLDRMSVGAMLFQGQSILQPFNGKVAEAAIWNVALSDSEVAQLALGASPSLIRPDSLVMYLPLVRDILDLCEATAFTTTGTAASDHPRVYMPSGIPRVARTGAAAGPSTISSSDSLKIGLTDGSLVKALLATADVSPLGLLEASAIRAAQSTADQLTIGLTETAQMAVAMSGTESLALGLVDSAALLNHSLMLDALPIGLVETATISLVNANAAEAMPIGLVESAVVLKIQTTSDQLSIGLIESSSVALTELFTLSSSEALALGLLEASQINTYTFTSDPVVIGLAEAAAISAVNANAEDSLSVGLADSGVVDRVVANANDAVPMGLGEQATVVICISSSDTLALGMQDSAAMAVSIQSSEALPLGLAEATLAAVAFRVQEDLPCNVGDVINAVRVALDGFDALGITVVEAATVIEPGELISKTSSDVLSLSIIEQAVISTVLTSPTILVATVEYLGPSRTAILVAGSHDVEALGQGDNV